MASRVVDPLRELYYRIQDNITSEENERIVNLAKVPEGKREEFGKKCYALFAYLQTKGDIKEDNVDCIRHLLRVAECISAIRYVDEYERRHVHPPPYTPQQPSAQSPAQISVRQPTRPPGFHYNPHRPPQPTTSPVALSSPRLLQGSPILMNQYNRGYIDEPSEAEVADSSMRDPPAAQKAPTLLEQWVDANHTDVRQGHDAEEPTEEAASPAVETPLKQFMIDPPATLKSPTHLEQWVAANRTDVRQDHDAEEPTQEAALPAVETKRFMIDGPCSNDRDTLQCDGPEESRIEARGQRPSLLASDLEPDGPKENKKITLRSYQLELAERGMTGENSIICAPTGSGKTYTAAYVCYNKWSGSRFFKAVFIVCIRNLINQQATALKEMFQALRKDEKNEIRIEEVNETVSVEECFAANDVLVLTAQTLLNSLLKAEVNLPEIDLMVLDECHHTDFSHPYNNIMHLYRLAKRRGKRLPQIMGLTASLGVGKEDDALKHYANMCANLDCPFISHVRENKDELEQRNPRPQKDQTASVPPRDPADLFSSLLKRMMGQIEARTAFPLNEASAAPGTQQYETWIKRQHQDAETQEHLADVTLSCYVLDVINRALMIYDDLQAQDVLRDVAACFNDLERQHSERETFLYKLFQENKDQLQILAKEETASQNPKLERFENLLHDLFSNQAHPIGIVLTRTIVNVNGLVRFIKASPHIGHLRVEKLVGQGRRDGTMTDNAQMNTIRSFRAGELDLLVATDVAQEGLDIPICNFVLKYNFVSNEIGSTQSRGRARAKNSECYLIVTRGSVNERREHENIDKEYRMLEALDEIDELEPDVLPAFIKEAQEVLVNQRLAAEERKHQRSNQMSVTGITIHCKKCKALLCHGSDMLKKGSNYICAVEDIENRVTLIRMHNPKKYRDDKQLDFMMCGNCDSKIGMKIEYLRGPRFYGYVLGKDGVMYKSSAIGSYQPIKQWSKVPFPIEEEASTAELLNDLIP